MYCNGCGVTICPLEVAATDMQLYTSSLSPEDDTAQRRIKIVRIYQNDSTSGLKGHALLNAHNCNRRLPFTMKA